MRHHFFAFAFMFFIPHTIHGQITVGLDYGLGKCIKNTKKSNSAGLQKFKSEKLTALSCFMHTSNDRIVNFGVQVSYVDREFEWVRKSPYGTIYYNTYIYIVPNFNLSYDRKRLLHFQILAPIGALISGKDRVLGAVVDNAGKYVRDTVTDSSENISRVNARVGLSVYGLIPVNQNISAMAKVEYTLSANQISTFHGYSVNPSDLLFKLGIAYKFNKRQ